MIEVAPQKTSLGEIRTFLMSVDGAPAPWTHPSKTVEALHDLLQSKCADEAFWRDLKDLTLRLEDNRFNPGVLLEAEALGSPTVDKLIDDLRASFGPTTTRQTQTLKRWMTNSMGATALSGFLLLGVATTGCDATNDTNETEEDTGTGTDADELCDEAVEVGIGGNDGEIFCDLIDIIEAADITIWQQNELLYCLPDLNAAFREALLDRFQTLTEEEIADELLDMLDFGGECSSEGTH